MSKRFFEIRIHGRGGQGGVTAARLLAEAAYKGGYKGVSAFPHFGAERRGAPVVAFTRIADEKIRIRSQIYEPDIVIVLDSSLLDIIDIAAGIKNDGTIVVNSPKKPVDLGLSGNFKIYTADATGVAVELGLILAGIPIINTPILGAFAKATGIVKLENIISAIKSKWSGKAGEINAKACELTYERTIRG